MDPHVRVLFTKFKLLKRYIFSTRINLDNIHKNYKCMRNTIILLVTLEDTQC